MPIYYITETKSALQKWSFEVLAETQEEALRMVQDGEIDPTDYEVDEDPFEGSYYSVDSEEPSDDIPNTNHGLDGH
jgi:hypothetical protein